MGRHLLSVGSVPKCLWASQAWDSIWSSCGWQGPKHLSHHLLPPREHLSRSWDRSRSVSSAGTDTACSTWSAMQNVQPSSLISDKPRAGPTILTLRVSWVVRSSCSGVKLPQFMLQLLHWLAVMPGNEWPSLCLLPHWQRGITRYRTRSLQRSGFPYN